IFFSGRENGKGSRNWVMNLDGSGLRPVTAENETGRLSQDESSVATLRDDALYLKDIESGKEVRLRDALPFRDLVFISWSNEKGKAYFVSREGTTLTIWSVDVVQGTKSALHRVDANDSEGATPIADLVITRDGKYFVFSADRRNSDLYLLKGAK
ncbi:MAG: hypothetical protein ABIP12_00690, partial [Terriglobales bacterium]